MARHFDRQIEKLKNSLLTLGGYVEQSVEDGLRAIETRDIELAHRVIKGDREIDRLEVDIEEECLHTLALYQPVAADLRFVICVVKINSELERVADLAVNLAEQALFLMDEATVADIPWNLEAVGLRARSMVKQSLDALVNNDVDLAGRVRESDDEVDRIHREMYQRVKMDIGKNPEDTGRLIDLLNVSRQLERIADHAVNIAEVVIYLVRGEILRHEQKPKDSSVPME